MPGLPLDILSLAIAVMKNEPKNTSRKLAIELLEDRSMLASIVVGNATDLTNGDTSSIIALAASDGGDGVSLREAILAANNTAGADEITFDFGHDEPETILLKQGELHITDDLTITGDGMDLLTIDASGSDPTPDIDNGDGTNIIRIGSRFASFFDVTLFGMTLTGADRNFGGAVGDSRDQFEPTTLTLINSRVTGNHALEGAVYKKIDQLTIQNSVISENSGGGGISAAYDTQIMGTTISNNDGGGVRVDSRATVEISDSLITGNTAEKGGGIYMFEINGGSYLRIENSTISNNTAEDGSATHGFTDGAAIYTFGTSLNLIGSTITGNHGMAPAVSMFPGRAFYGTGIYANTLRVTDSIVTNNSGSGISGSVTGSSEVSGSTFSGNGGTGLALRVVADFHSTMRIQDSTFTGNHAGLEVGSDYLASLQIRNVTVTDNRGSGGGYLSAEIVSVQDSVIARNETDLFGAGIETGLDTLELTLTNTTVSENVSTTDGQPHGAAIRGGRFTSVTLIQSTITGNTKGINAEDGPISSLSLYGSIFDQELSGPVTADFSLISIADNAVITGSGNQTGTAANPLDPLLGPLADNGGSTLTHALLPGSPALNAGQGPPLITPTAVESSTTDTELFPAGNLINNSGLSGPTDIYNYQTVTHAVASSSTAWVTDQPGPIGSDYYELDVDPRLRFQLGQPKELSGLVLWGYQLGAPHNNEAKSFSIAFSLNGGSSYHSYVQIEHQRTGGEQETIDFGQTYTANAVRMNITDNHFGTPGASGGGRVGLGEVKFLPPSSEFDQRGEPFARVVGNQTDIGAYESQGIPSFSPGDYNRDGLVNAADYTVWRDALGQTVTPGVGADGDGSGTIDAADYSIWRSHFGNGLQFNSGSGSSSSQLATSATDTAFAQFSNPPITSSDIQQPIESTTARPAPSLLLDGSEEFLLLAGFQTDQSIDHNRDDFEALPDVEDESDTAGDLPPLAFRFDEFP